MQSSNKDLIESKSRRRSFIMISGGLLSLIGTLYLKTSPKKSSDQEEFILVNGWVLKKKDLNVV